MAQTVGPGDVDGVAGAIVDALERERPSDDSFERVREHYYWPRVARPLVEFCDSPSRAPDLQHHLAESASCEPPQERPGSYTRSVPSPKTTVSQLRDRAIGGLIRTIAANTADEAVGRVSSRIDDVERILGDQGDAADEVAEVIGRTLTRLSAEVTALNSEIAQLRAQLEQLKSST